MELDSLDFSSGAKFEAEIWRRFGSPISFVEGRGLKEFFLVVSVGRCKLKLSETSVAQILQVAIGDNAPSFCVLSLGDRVFHFSISSKSIGLFIYNLRSFECETFKISVHLWGQGGHRCCS
jgi:hypothetical protein